MRFTRVLLITQPIYEGKNRNLMPTNPPASLGYLAEALKRKCLDYEIYDSYLYQNERPLMKQISRFRPDLIGISLYTYQYKGSYDLLRRIKRSFPNIQIIAGGPHLSVMREGVLKECSAINYGVVLEGEETLLELCLGININQIEGLIHRVNGFPVYNGDRPLITDLDQLPFPTLDKFELKRYTERRIGIISSRGCPYSCGYCPVKLTIGQRFRSRSPRSVTEEIHYWYERGYRDFSFFDDNFTLLPSRVYEICKLIRTAGMQGLRFSLPNGVRADKVSLDLLKEMRSVGFDEIAFGVEVGNDRMLHRIKKQEKMETIERSISHACSLGYRVILFFIIGYPGESWQDLEDSFKIARRYPVFSVRFYNLIPFPGTELYNYLEKNGGFLHPPDEYLNNGSGISNEPTFQTPELSLEERKKAFAEGERIHREVLRRYLRHKFDNLGFCSGLLVALVSSEVFLNAYWNKPTFRKLVARFKRYL